MCNCRFSDILVEGEIRRGFSSDIKFKCSMCNLSFKISTCETINEARESLTMDINYASVLGTASIGCGYSQLQEMMTIMDVPSVSVSTYDKLHKRIGNDSREAASKSMREAIEEEKILAIERGDVDKNGIPLLTVVVDGCWSHRSYGTKYSSLSGAASIIGFFTKKVIWIGVRNKYCRICTIHINKKEEIPEHNCNANFSGPSTAMEASILLEGFMASEKLYNVKYSRMIGDGDSSVYNKILQYRPYKDLVVEKIECKNHLFRNYRKKMKDVHTKTKIFKKEISLNIGRLIRDITVIKKKYSSYPGSIEERARSMAEDIRNAPFHVFDNHSQCKNYFCQKETTTTNFADKMKNDLAFKEILAIHNKLATFSKSLVHNVDTNIVEQYNSIIAKMVGGKRINFSTGQSYRNRCLAAVIQHNSKAGTSYLYKSAIKSSPPKRIKHLELKRLQSRNRSQNAIRRKLFKSVGPDVNYGPNCAQQDLSASELAVQQKLIMGELEANQNNRVDIERKTIGQSDCMEWQNIRKNMLTASNFGKVCKLTARGKRGAVLAILYSSFTNAAMLYGKQHEKDAIASFSNLYGVMVRECGIFIDREHSYLAASPDGLIDGEDGIVEVKCPSSAKDMSIIAAVRENKIKCLQYNKERDCIIGLKKSHPYYYQIQGQLHIADRKYCILIIWTNVEVINDGLYTERIDRDDTFWAKKMLTKLNQFYFGSLLPEIVDPRQKRNMPIRD